jgi:hypothetical protein
MVRLCPGLKDANDEAEAESVAGGGDAFFKRRMPVEDGLAREVEELDNLSLFVLFSFTGDNPCMRADHGAICFATMVAIAAALFAAVALLTKLEFELGLFGLGYPNDEDEDW